MYYGKLTVDLEKARSAYKDIFGYDPNSDMELEFGNHDEYLNVLRQCIAEKKDMFEILGE